MIISDFNNIEIIGISTAVPDKVLNIRDFNSKFGESNVTNFIKMTGVEKVHIADSNQTAADLGYAAAQDIIKRNDIDTEKIGCLIFVSQTPDYHIPSTACVLHHRLKLNKNCLAFDINLGCSGFVYGMQVISSIIENSNIDFGLLILADTLSKTVSSEDKSAAMLFGDAGSAVLLSKNSINIHSMKISLRTKGDGYRAIIVQAGSNRNPVGDHSYSLKDDGNIRSDYNLYMNGTEVFNFTISEVPTLINEFLQYIGKNPEDYDALVLHQANKFIMKQIAKKTGFDKRQMLSSIEQLGNTSVASIPATLSCIYGSSDDEDKPVSLLLSGYGVGLSWGVIDVTINTSNIYPVIKTLDYFNDGGIRYE